jgi:Histidine kinase-, DNA gyrase B-, and HSP90-like ATPase
MTWPATCMAAPSSFEEHDRPALISCSPPNQQVRHRAVLNRTMFTTSRLLDFASEQELVAQTGHQKDAWPVVLLKELVDNAIDAAEESGIPPVITVTVDRTGIVVEDNGPGIPTDVVEAILDFSIRVSSREAYVSPTRGAQGNALKTVLAMPFVLDGRCGRVEIEARGTQHVVDFAVDRIRQQPVVEHHAANSNITIGTRIKVEWPDSALLNPRRGKPSVFTSRQSVRLAEPASDDHDRLVWRTLDRRGYRFGLVQMEAV